jgi:hypothetical protein
MGIWDPFVRRSEIRNLIIGEGIDYMAKFAEVKALLVAQAGEIAALRERVDALVSKYDAQAAAHAAEMAELAGDVAGNTDKIDDILLPTGGESAGGITE